MAMGIFNAIGEAYTGVFGDKHPITNSKNFSYHAQDILKEKHNGPTLDSSENPHDVFYPTHPSDDDELFRQTKAMRNGQGSMFNAEVR